MTKWDVRHRELYTTILGVLKVMDWAKGAAQMISLPKSMAGIDAFKLKELYGWGVVSDDNLEEIGGGEHDINVRCLRSRARHHD